MARSTTTWTSCSRSLEVRGLAWGAGGRGESPPQGSQEPCKNGVVSVLGRVTFQQKRKRLAARYVVSCKLVFSPPRRFQD